METNLRWWQQSVIYQIVVPSFQDSNGDGVGDLPGIIDRLDYLEWLGVGTIWLTPIYPSPMVDLGYDVSDYTGVNPQFGSLEDFDRLVAEAGQRGLKVMLDWVPNHTSDQHAWFAESRSGRDHPKRDWYIWHDAKPDGSPPNNWISVFGGSGWEWDERSSQYYYHSFLPSQPDLNWRNPEVRSAVFDAMRFWLQRGVAGFRVDALSWLIKDDQFHDNPPNPNYQPEKDGPDLQVTPKYTWDQPQVHEMVAQMRQVSDEFDDRVLLGELVLPIEKIVTYYGDERPELHLPANLHLSWSEWKAEALGGIIADYTRVRPANGWPTWTMSTHDFPRLVHRAGRDHIRIAAMLLLTLGGTPTLYYGEELGMHGVPIPPERARDPQGRRIGRNRDPQRTPMQWNDGPQASFTSGAPWLPIGDDLPTANVAAQTREPHSLLTLYRKLLALRSSSPTLIAGDLEIILQEHPLLAYRRSDPKADFLVVLNLESQPQSYRLNLAGRILLSTHLDRDDEPVHDDIDLRDGEGVVVRLR